jgi:hypothetical protein
MPLLCAGVETDVSLAVVLLVVLVEGFRVCDVVVVVLVVVSVVVVGLCGQPPVVEEIVSVGVVR